MLQAFAGFMLGVPIGMMVMALFTSSKVSGLYSELGACHTHIKRLEKELKTKKEGIKKEAESYYPQVGCTFDE